MKLILLALALALPAVAAEKVDITGKWDIAVETSAGSGNPTADFKQEGEKLTGTYTGRFGESKLEGAVKEKKVDFKVHVVVEGEKYVFSYTGTIEEDGTMKGQVDLGGLADGTWTAKRAEKKKD